MSKSDRSVGIVSPRTVIVTAFVLALIGTVTAPSLHRSAVPFAVLAWVLGTAIIFSVVRSRRGDGGGDPGDDGRGGLGTPVLRPIPVKEPSRAELLQAALEEARRRRRGLWFRVLVAGATGFIGSALVRRLQADGAEVHPIARRPIDGAAYLDLSHRTLDCTALPEGSLDGIDVVYALGGDPLTPRRWGPAKRRSIESSRIGVVDTLARAIANSSGRPAALVAMSAVGIYGERGDEVLTEDSAAGKGFVPDLCIGWERAASPARNSGARVVAARSGIVFGRGGFLSRLEPIFRLGLGGRLGNGQQWMSWIALDDTVAALALFGIDERFSGPVNLTSPNPIRNRQLTKMLAMALRRPAVLAVPRTLITAAAGRRVANEFLLQSARVLPDRLMRAEFPFNLADPESAILDSVTPGQ